MTQCHAIYLVIFAVSTCKANGHAGFERLDTTQVEAKTGRLPFKTALRFKIKLKKMRIMSRDLKN
jgi:hypothetical protein